MPHLALLAPGLVAAVILAAAPGAASAAETRPGAVFELRGGLAARPTYPGADEIEIGPDAGLRFNYVRLPGGLAFGTVDELGIPRGFGATTSLRYIGSRKPGDDPSLAGTERIDPSLELGFGLGYQSQDWRAFGVLRYGVIGHNALVGEAGADALFRPREDVVINLGPRANWGSDRFMQTYFGVTAEEAENAPQLEAFAPSSGLYSVGVELGARYQFSERWGLEGAATYDRLVDDAADSPITQAGSRDQFGVRFGITRSIRLGF